MANLIEVILNPSVEVAKVNAGAISRGVVAFGENIKAIFEVNETAPVKAIEFKYLMPTESDDLTGYAHAGTVAFNDGETVISVYFKEM
ncbi:MAG: hypothetical protein HQL08_06710 [Nitrospirae bacterium]|nr:hypothetical protein [Nitrospirota bacterium]